jgi:acyl carrier protein
MYNVEQDLDPKNTLHIPIGKSLGKRSVYIVDSSGRLVPPNVPGELCFGGDLIARGYLDNPTLTAEKFIPNKFTDKPGDRIYKTGDLARYGNNGLIEYLGRVDSQVKVRGYRIELREIENILLKHETINEAIVTVISNKNSDSNIIAYVITKNGEQQIDSEIKKHLEKNLPKYMLPTYTVVLSEFPINTNGKVDIKNLPKPKKLNVETKTEFIVPRSDLEKSIAEIVAEILNVEKVGINDNFFELGGHSILAIKVITKVRETFGVEVQLKSLFENPTIIGLSEAVISEQSNLVEDDELEKLLNELEMDN